MLTQAHAHQKMYGYDSSTYSVAPITALDSLLSSLTPYLPITLLPGATDPTGVTLPQQALPRRMFAQASKSAAFDCVTNPCWMELGGRTVLGAGGQTLDDIFKYVDDGGGGGGGEGEGDEAGGAGRLEMAKDTLEWRHMAPTAPDTLCLSLSSCCHVLGCCPLIALQQGAIPSTTKTPSSSSKPQTSTSSGISPPSPPALSQVRSAPLVAFDALPSLTDSRRSFQIRMASRHAWSCCLGSPRRAPSSSSTPRRSTCGRSTLGGRRWWMPDV